MRILLLIIFLLIVNCKFNKVVDSHGVHYLDKKQQSLTVNKSNKNDIIKLLGPPSTKSKFDNDLWIYIERKKTTKDLYCQRKWLESLHKTLDCNFIYYCSVSIVPTAYCSVLPICTIL